MSAVSYYFLLCIAGALVSLLTHELWSHIQGFSHFTSLLMSAVRRTEVAIVVFITLSFLATTIRSSLLVSGFTMGASAFVTIVAGATMAVFLMEVLPSKLDEAWAVVLVAGSSLALYGLYPVKKITRYRWHILGHGAYLSLSAVGSYVSIMYIFIVYENELENLFKSWHIYPGTNAFVVYVFATAWGVMFIAWNHGLRRVARALELPR